MSTKQANVVLIGSTGHGKSAFGNWIHDFGQAKPPAFIVGNTPDPCTQTVVAKKVQVCADKPLGAVGDPNAVTLNLIDTPGLNEERVEQDVKHMCDLLQVVHELKHLSCVVICIDFGFRRDSQVVATLQYYQQLFQPVFTAGNVFIVLTKVTSNNYAKGSEEWDKALKVRRETFNNIFGFEIQESNIFALSSCFPNRKLAKVINRAQGTLTIPAKNSLLNASLVARSQFISTSSQLTPISMEGHLFPLPPCLEVIRRNRLQVVNEKLAQLERTLSAESKEAGQFIQKERVLQDEIEQIAKNINGVEQQIREKLQVQRTAPQLAYDNTMFLRNKIVPLQFECPLATFDIEEQKYNCSYQKAQSGGILVVTPSPDLFTFRWKELPESRLSARWFLRMQLAYSGEEYYKEAILKHKSEKQKLLDIKSVKVETKHNLEAEHRKLRSSIEVHQKHRASLETEKELFIHTSFELVRIPELLERLMRA